MRESLADSGILADVKKGNRNRLISTFFTKDDVRPNASWTGRSGSWFNVTSPYFRAMTGDIPLRPELFEILAFDYNNRDVKLPKDTNLWGEDLELEIVMGFSGRVCDLTDDSDVFGWTKEQLRKAIVDSPRGVTLLHLR